ncbi:YhgE/Pip domain-containing protein [Streptomyces sp. NPDC004111]|uniref:YhgE/Pip domain-containing protein n=1 Tax=Streptomyces sp. NPDC004111 TaxID=3364690 RepID=UPI0036B60F4A
MSADRPHPSESGKSAGALLGNVKLWIAPGVLSGLVALFVSLLYMGGILTPETSMSRLPIALVNEDTGKPAPGARANLGTQVSSQIIASTPGDRVQWRRLDHAAAQDQLASGKAYGVLIIPADFTGAVRSLAGPEAERPTLTVLTNPGMGSLGSSMASRISEQAAHRASAAVGKQLLATPELSGAPSATRLLLADPVAVETRIGHPIGTHSGMGLSAFYYVLLLVLAGFLSANIIHNSVDTALGYADAEIGPWHSRHRTVPINRTQTLLLKMSMSAGLCVPITALVMIACIVVLGMDAHHLPMLTAFSYFACLAVAIGVQAINAAFGSIGQLVSMFVFIALALPSSGATVPLEAVPGFYRFLSVFEPMHQLVSGVRSILYFDARADAGLTRGWIMIGIGIAAALAFGFLMTRYYDRKGLHRMVPQPG